MSLLDNLRAAIGRLAPRGWNVLMQQHGLHLDAADLAAELRANYQGKVILVCWHHGQIPALLRALGAAPETLLPNGKWPKDVYDWVIMVSFDENGHVIPERTKRVTEHLLQGDSQ